MFAGSSGQQRDLDSLETSLLSYLKASKSPATVKCYSRLFLSWQTFAQAHRFQPVPAADFNVALFLTSLLDKGSGKSTIIQSAYAIKFFHELEGREFSLKSPYIRGLLEAAKRVCSAGGHKKDPITADMLKILCDTYRDSISLPDVRDLAFMTTSYAGFLRYDEVSSLKATNVKILERHMELRLEKAKTDQYRQGNVVCIARGQSVACPVACMERYIEMAAVDMRSEKYIFRPLFNRRGKAGLIKTNKKISYSRIRSCVKAKFGAMAETKDLDIGLHSFRSGGATAAMSANVSYQAVKRHGRWRAEASMDRYIQKSLAEKLTVSQSLDL